MGINSDGSVTPTKAELRRQQDEAMQQFLSNGGQVTKLPYHSPGYGEMRERQAEAAHVVKKVIPTRELNFHEESKRLAAQADELDKEDFRRTDMAFMFAGKGRSTARNKK